MSRQQFEHLSQHSVRMSHGLISPVCSVVYGQFNCTKQVEIRPSYSAVCGTAVLASITFRNNCGIDIVASNVDALRTVSIQVKTNKCGASSWMLGRKSETFFSETHFYVFVALRVVGERPDFFVAPSTDVANFVRTSHSR